MSEDLQTVNIAGFNCPLGNSKSPFVPTPDGFLENAVDGQLLRYIMANVISGHSVLLEGPTGAGKTSTIRHLASLTKNAYKRFQLTGSTDVDSFVGRWLLNEKGTFWVDGILTESMRNGYWLLLDELNMALPEIVALINSVLDDDKSITLTDKDGEKIVAHPNFRLFAAINPSDDYAGTKELNRATLDRFIPIPFPYATKENEIRIIEKRSGIDRTIGEDKKLKRGGVLSRMVEMASIIRNKEKEGGFSSICSTRQLVQWATLCNHLEIKEAAKLAVINKISKSEITFIETELGKIFQDGETIEKHKEEDKKRTLREAEDAKVKSKTVQELKSTVANTALTDDEYIQSLLSKVETFRNTNKNKFDAVRVPADTSKIYTDGEEPPMVTVQNTPFLSAEPIIVDTEVSISNAPF